MKFSSSLTAFCKWEPSSRARLPKSKTQHRAAPGESCLGVACLRCPSIMFLPISNMWQPKQDEMSPTMSHVYEWSNLLFWVRYTHTPKSVNLLKKLKKKVLNFACRYILFMHTRGSTEGHYTLHKAKDSWVLFSMVVTHLNL